MQLIPIFRCDLIDAATRDVLRSLTLPAVPRIGETIALESTNRGTARGSFRVTNVSYAIDESQRVGLGHLDR